MNISENIYHSTRAFLMGGAGETEPRAGADFFSSLEEMRRELADPESRFYQETRETMARTLRENDQRRKEDAVIDALMALVDSMNGAGKAETGLLGAELGLAQDGDPREPLTTEMLAFLAVLRGREVLQAADTEAEKVRESGGSRSTDAAEGVLTEDRIAGLAERYDPHHMEQSEFVEFMDTLAAEGAMRPEDAEAVRDMGKWKVTVGPWRLEDGNGRVIDSGTGWTPPGRMDQMRADRWMLPCLYDGGEDDGDVLAWARLGVLGAYSEGFQALADILVRMERVRSSGGSEERRELSDEEIGEFAVKYDPHDMSREAYDAFLDDLVEAGALSQNETGHLGRTGMTVPFTDALYAVRADVVTDEKFYEPSFGWLFTQAPNDPDVLGWLGRRMQWTMGSLNDASYAREEKAAFAALSNILRRMETVRAGAKAEIRYYYKKEVGST